MITIIGLLDTDRIAALSEIDSGLLLTCLLVDRLGRETVFDQRVLLWR